MYRYILFDLDGTLIDTNDLVISSLKETSRRFLNKDLSEEDLNVILGKSLSEQIGYMSRSMHNEMLICYKKFYSAHHDEMIKEFPGIRAMLEKLKQRQCKIGIVSSKGSNGINRGLAHFGFESFIDVIVSAYDVENHKPHPEPALKAIKLLDALPGKTLLVGDSPYDILCAKNAGIGSALVDWTIFPKEAVFRTNPDYIIKSPKDLVEIISGA